MSGLPESEGFIVPPVGVVSCNGHDGTRATIEVVDSAMAHMKFIK